MADTDSIDVTIKRTPDVHEIDHPTCGNTEAHRHGAGVYWLDSSGHLSMVSHDGGSVSATDTGSHIHVTQYVDLREMAQEYVRFSVGECVTALTLAAEYVDRLRDERDAQREEIAQLVADCLASDAERDALAAQVAAVRAVIDSVQPGDDMGGLFSDIVDALNVRLPE